MATHPTITALAINTLAAIGRNRLSMLYCGATACKKGVAIITSVRAYSESVSFITRDLGITPYREGYALQLEAHARVVAGGAPELLLLEHHRVITQGRKDFETTNLVASLEELTYLGVEVVPTERGGTATYHGPGQLVAYPIFPVGRRVRDFLRRLENVQIRTLEMYGLTARPNPGYAGVYVGDDKIGSIGVAIRQNVALHGLALNVNTRLEDFELITPCGLTDTRMTSMQKLLGYEISMFGVKARLEAAFRTEFDGYKWLEERRGEEVAYPASFGSVK